MSKTLVERSIWIDAPRERVWTAITDPVQIQQWFSPGTAWVLTSLAVGGKVYAVGYEAQTGIIETVDPPRRFSYRTTLETADAALTLVTTYTLEAENGGTRVTISEHGPDSDAGRAHGAQSGGGWDMALANLQAYLEGMALPFPEGL